MPRAVVTESRRVAGERVRDEVRLRMPRTLAFYQRKVRPRLTGERRHLDLSDWVAAGTQLVEEFGPVGIRFDSDGAWFEDPSGFLWYYQGSVSGTGTWAEHGKEYEEGETALMQELLPPGATMVDIGANVGLHSIKLIRRVEDLRIIAFEPVPETLEALRRNMRKNGVGDEIEIHQVALTDQDGQVRITSTLQIRNFVVPAGTSASDAATELVPCRRLDDALSPSLDRIDLIKCDVEGGELDVLRGASATLRRFRPPIFIEIVERYARRYGHGAGAVFQFLNDHGYRHELVVGGKRSPATGSLLSDLDATPNFLFQPA